MPRIDLFNFFRYVLEIVVGVYASVVTLQSLYGTLAMLSGEEKHISMIRRYVIVHVLRLRFLRFWHDELVCLLLLVVMCLIWQAHRVVSQIDRTLHSDATRISKSG